MTNQTNAPKKVPEISTQYAQVMQQLRQAQNIASRFNITISPNLVGLTWYVEGVADSVWESLCDQIIKSEPIAEAPVSRQDLEALFTIFDFTLEEKKRLYEACNIDDEAFSQWAATERRLDNV
jgi:hypothetical protein